MHNYIAVILMTTGKAYKGLHALWQLDADGDITVHGTTVVHRDQWGEFQVDTKETHPALATAVGVGVGALLGALAGPAGAAVGAAGGAAIGAAAGGAVGVGADLVRADTRDQATDETAFVLAPANLPSSPTCPKTRLSDRFADARARRNRPSARVEHSARRRLVRRLLPGQLSLPL